MKKTKGFSIFDIGFVWESLYENYNMNDYKSTIMILNKRNIKKYFCKTLKQP